MAGGRPSKPLLLVQGHRTKAEKEIRKKGEEELLTKTRLKEWPEVKANLAAHREFRRLKKLLNSIGKDDDLFGAMVNTHCLLKGEIEIYEDMKTAIVKQIEQIVDMYKNTEIEATAYIQERGKLHDRYMTCDKKIMEKRKMMMDISKENIMTIQGALRAVPKTPDKTQEKSKMAAFLERRQVK